MSDAATTSRLRAPSEAAAADSWRPPPAIYGRLDAEFRFALDAACSTTNCLAPRGLTVEEGDSLVRDWTAEAGGPGKAVWLNPPYSRARAFLAKAIDAAGRGSVVVALVNADTSARWWRDLVVNYAREVRFISGRVKFLRPEGTGSATNPGASAILIFDGGPPMNGPAYSYMEATERRWGAVARSARAPAPTSRRKESMAEHARTLWLYDLPGLTGKIVDEEAPPAEAHCPRAGVGRDARPETRGGTGGTVVGPPCGVRGPLRHPGL